MYNGNYKVASLVYIYNVFVCSKTIFSPVNCISWLLSLNLFVTIIILTLLDCLEEDKRNQAYMFRMKHSFKAPL